MGRVDPEERRAYQRAWYAAHVEEERDRQRRRYQTDARSHCDRTNAREKLPEVKARRKELREMKMAERKHLISEFKAERGCQMCGERHPACLDFHHRDPLAKERRGKVSTISDIMRKASLERLMEEIRKCDILCSNCHRKAHAEMGYEWMIESVQ